MNLHFTPYHKLIIYDWEDVVPEEIKRTWDQSWPCLENGPYIYLAGPTMTLSQQALQSCPSCVEQKEKSIKEHDLFKAKQHDKTKCRFNEAFYTRDRLKFAFQGNLLYNPIKNFKTPFPFGFLRFQDDQIHVKGVSLPRELRRKILWIIVMLFFDSIEFVKTIFMKYERRTVEHKEANQRVYQFLKEKAF
jgi:hypothetical protein